MIKDEREVVKIKDEELVEIKDERELVYDQELHFKTYREAEMMPS